jgi:hypothetical protein
MFRRCSGLARRCLPTRADPSCSGWLSCRSPPLSGLLSRRRRRQVELGRRAQPPLSSAS